MLLPVLNEELRFHAVPEPLHGKIFVSESAAATFRHSVLPWLAWVNQHAFDSSLLHPFEQRHADEFGAVVTSQLARCASHAD